jgi:hypothetical protein
LPWSAGGLTDHQQPSGFYRDLLARTLGRPRVELFSDEASRLELAVEAEPWLLVRALEASSVGQGALEALEEAVGEVARSYPRTAPTVVARPVLEHFRDVTRLLDGPLPVARRQRERLAVVAGHLAGLAGSLAFDLRDEGKALAYFKVAVQAADDADAPDLAAWALATRSLIPTYSGDPAAALALLQEAQDRAHGHRQRPGGPRSWSAAKASTAARSTSSAPRCMRPPTAWPMLARSATPAAGPATTIAATPPWPASSAWTEPTSSRLVSRRPASPSRPPPAMSRRWPS